MCGRIFFQLGWRRWESVRLCFHGQRSEVAAVCRQRRGQRGLTALCSSHAFSEPAACAADAGLAEQARPRPSQRPAGPTSCAARRSEGSERCSLGLPRLPSADCHICCFCLVISVAACFHPSDALFAFCLFGLRDAGHAEEGPQRDARGCAAERDGVRGAAPAQRSRFRARCRCGARCCSCVWSLWRAEGRRRGLHDAGM